MLREPPKCEAELNSAVLGALAKSVLTVIHWYRQMKIALVIKHYSLYQGGAERYAVDQSRALVDEGHEVHILANRYEPHGPNKIHFHPVSMRSKPSWLRVILFSQNARRIIEKEHFDVVYALTQIYPQDMYLTGGGVYRHWMHVRYPFAPLRWIAYLSRPIHLVNVYLESRIYDEKNNKIIVANSLLCKRHAEEYWGVPSNRIRVIYHGVDHDIFNPQNATAERDETRQALGIKEDTPVILFVSNNWKRKGLSALLRAVGLIESPKAPFDLAVVGRGNPKSYKKLADKLGLSERVHFIGHTNDILRYFGIADLVVLPTLYDSFGNVCIEAMACGVPVITSGSSGVSELIRAGENGYVLDDPRDFKELANLLELCADLTRLKAMGRLARETALAYTPARNVRETMEACQQVFAEKTKRDKDGVRKHIKSRITNA